MSLFAELKRRNVFRVGMPGDQFIENLRGDPHYEAMVEKMGIRVD